HLERHHRAYRVSRKTEHGDTVHHGQALWSARLHGHRTEIAAQRDQHFPHHFEIALGDTAGGDHQIGRRGGGAEQLPEVARIVTTVLDRDDLDTVGGERRGQRDTVRVVDLTGSQRVARRDQFVAGTDDDRPHGRENRQL